LYTSRKSKGNVDEKFDAPVYVPTEEKIPSFIDYRALGYVTPVKDQVQIYFTRELISLNDFLVPMCKLLVFFSNRSS